MDLSQVSFSFACFGCLLLIARFVLGPVVFAQTVHAVETRIGTVYRRGWRPAICWVFVWMLFRLANGWHMGDLPTTLGSLGAGGGVAGLFGFLRTQEAKFGVANLPAPQPANDAEAGHGFGRDIDQMPEAA